MPRKWHITIALLAVLSPTLSSQLDAQMIKWSQSGSVTQMLGDTEIEIRYSRPVARGRELFGGQRLPAGKYSIWMIPDPESWTVIVSSATDVYHTPYPEGEDVLRMRVEPERGMHMETLTFHFPVVDGPNAVLPVTIAAGCARTQLAY